MPGGALWFQSHFRKSLGEFFLPPKDSGWWRLQHVHLALRLSSRSMLRGASLNGELAAGHISSSFYWSMVATDSVFRFVQALALPEE